MLRLPRLQPVLVLAAIVASGTPSVGLAQTTRPWLRQALASLKVPPDWFAQTNPQWDMSQPWKEARLEIRRLLAMSDEPQRIREAVKLTWLYAQKNDIGDGHELPMYLFMSGQYAWAAAEYPRYLQRVAGKGATHAYLCYASVLAHFGEYQQALAVLDQAARDLPPDPWRINSMANIQNLRGDICAQMGDTAGARRAYEEAIRLYPQSNQPYGRHLLHRQAAKVQTKLDLLTMRSLESAGLRDGTYTGRVLAYSDKSDMTVTVVVRNGRIADIRLKHDEKIDLGATRIIPQRIIEKQSLKVDVVTGATITSQAIVDGTFQALKQAGLK